MHTEANAIAHHPTPHWTAVVREQLRTVGASVRAELVVAGVAMTGVTLLLLWYALRGEHTNFLMVDMTGPVVVFALFAPLGVWKGESPSGRGYLWTLPVARPRHTLVKVLGGWGWLMAAVAAYLAWGVGVAMLTGGGLFVGGDHAQEVTRHHLPSERRVAELSLQAWMWLVPFTGATVTYLIGSAVAIWSDRPWRWFATTAFVFVVVAQVVDAAFGTVDPTSSAVMSGRYGLLSVITGMPSASIWAGATLVWLGFALVAVLAAAHHYQER
jgi:hypothetical protein